MKIELMCEVCDKVCEVVEVSENELESFVWDIVVCDDCRNVCDRCGVIGEELKDGVCEECFVSGWGVKKVSFLFRLKWDGGFVEKVFDNWSEGMKWVREGKGWLWNVGIESKGEVEKGF